MNALVAKFVGYYNQATNRRKSGDSETDVIMNAHAIFKTDMGKDFTLKHAWHLLKVEPKWKAMILSGGSSKRTKIDEHGDYSSSSNLETQSNGGEHDEPLVRPPGIKAWMREAH